LTVEAFVVEHHYNLSCRFGKAGRRQAGVLKHEEMDLAGLKGKSVEAYQHLLLAAVARD